MGAPQDLVQSWLWFSVAAQQGDADAAKKRDEVAAKMDAATLLAAAKALAAFKVSTPSPAANEAPAPPGGWDAKPGAPQASRRAGARRRGRSVKRAAIGSTRAVMWRRVPSPRARPRARGEG